MPKSHNRLCPQEGEMRSALVVMSLAAVLQCACSEGEASSAAGTTERVGESSPAQLDAPKPSEVRIRPVTAGQTDASRLKQIDAQRAVTESEVISAEVNAEAELSVYRPLASRSDPSKALTDEEQSYLVELEQRNREAEAVFRERPSRSVPEAEERLRMAQQRLERARKVTKGGVGTEISTWQSPGYKRCQGVLQRGEAALKAEVAKGDADCQYFLGMIRKTEARSGDEEVAAWAMVFDAAEKGSPEAQFALATAYYQGKFGRSQDSLKAAEWLRRAAESGHPQAKLFLQVAALPRRQ